MPLIPSSPRRERFLFFGPEKVGKSHAALTIANYTDTKFFVADGDFAWYANLEGFPNIDQSRILIRDDLVTWEDYVNWCDDAIRDAEKDDFIIVDRVDHLRDAAVNHYLEAVYGQGASDWFLSQTAELAEENRSRRDQGKGRKTAYMEIQYDIVNSYYAAFLNRLNTRARKQHVIWVASAKQLYTEGQRRDQPRTIAKYSIAGEKPAGGNQLPAIPSTILYFGQIGDKRVLTTIGDRGREQTKKLNNTPFNDFVTTYLMPIAKWKIVGNEEPTAAPSPPSKE